jgi:RNA-directed DNA polymerase
MAVLLVIEPIFEADFLGCSHGFRPGRRAHGAVDEIRENLKAGRREFYDADLSSYFDSIPHEKLMGMVERRIADRSVLKLIRMWLRSPVGKDGGGSGKQSRMGTPQGGVISPLLANIYLHALDRAFHGTRMVRIGERMLGWSGMPMILWSLLATWEHVSPDGWNGSWRGTLACI